MLSSQYGQLLDLQGYELSRLPLRSLRYGPMTRNHPLGGFVDRLQSLGFPPPCYPNYGLLTFTPAGLSPAEHISLRWTHIPYVRFSRIRLTDYLHPVAFTFCTQGASVGTSYRPKESK